MSLLAWAIILLVIGIFILVLEMFVPSSGILGVLATMSIVGAIWLGFTHSLVAGTLILLTAVIVVPVILVAAVHYWPRTPIGRRILIQPPTDDDVLPESDAKDQLAALIGKRGRARTEMLPGGSVDLDGRRYDAVSDSGAVDPGTPIIVVRVETRRLVVRVDDAPNPALLDSPIDPALPTQPEAIESAKPVAVAKKENREEGSAPESPFDEPLI